MAVSAQLVAATPQQANPDAKRSRAEQEAALALMSGKKVKTTMHSIDGKIHKNAHKMDIVEINDGLSSAIEQKTDKLMEWIETLKPSPESKTMKKIEAVSKQISSMLAEIKQLTDMNADGTFDTELNERREALKVLSNKRKNLEKSLASSDKEIVID